MRRQVLDVLVTAIVCAALLGLGYLLGYARGDQDGYVEGILHRDRLEEQVNEEPPPMVRPTRGVVR